MKKTIACFIGILIVATSGCADAPQPVKQSIERISNQGTTDANSGEVTIMLSNAMRDMMKIINEASLAGDPDRDYILLMTAHHKGFIALAKEEILHGTNDLVKIKARRIIEVEKKELAEMEKLRLTSKETNMEFGSIAKREMQNSSAALLGFEGDNIDANFLNIMKHHHQQGISLTQLFIKNGNNPILLRIAERILQQAKNDM